MRRIKLIAGPCSAESPEQLHNTVSGIVSRRADLESAGFELEAFRAGAWKPRTRPGCFEGAGEKAVDWVSTVQSELSLEGMVEVAKSSHVDAILKAGLKRVWIGARTATNPFDTQEIADALRGCGEITVFVKNPVNPDVDLWQGAIERFRAVGIAKVAAIHRGFSFYEKSRYRNLPKWQVPIELMQRMPEVPMYGDASHITGRREFIPEVAQKALDLGFAGLFLESHVAPDTALSDNRQQLTPEDLAALLLSLSIKDIYAQSRSLQKELEQLRSRIDVIDENLLDVIAERMAVVENLGAFKKEHNLTILQQPRWEQIQQIVCEGAKNRGLDPAFVEELFQLLHQAAIDRQA